MSIYTRTTPIGVNLDQDPVELNGSAYQVLENMVPRVGKMARARGYEEIWTPPLFPPQYLLFTPQLGAQVWLYAGTSNIATVDALGQHTDRTPLVFPNPVAANGWTGGNLNGIAVVNALENEPHYWFQGQALATILPGLRPLHRYQIMRPFKYHLIGLGYNDGFNDIQDGIQWSDAADPGQIPQTWVPAQDNEAGDNILADENGAIIDGYALRDGFFIYKQNSVYEMSYVGGNEVFRFSKVFGTTGVLTRNCIARVKGSHVVLGNGDIYQHDGQNIRSLISGKLGEQFFNAIDDENFEASFVAYLEQTEEVWFCVPSIGNTRPNIALVWNVETDSFGYRDIPFSDFAAAGVVGFELGAQEVWDTDDSAWDTDSTQWTENTLQTTQNALLIADASNSLLYLGDSTSTANGTAFSSNVGMWGLDLGEPNREKSVRRVWPRINAPEGMEFDVKVYSQSSPQAPVKLRQQITYTPDGSGLALDVNARYLGIEFGTIESLDWDVAGFDFEYYPRGRF